MGRPTAWEVTLNDPGFRFWSKVNKQPNGGCWLWTACKTYGGYGVFCLGGGKAYAHRITYELLVGPIPEGMEIDHGPVCHNPSCVNPAHLRLATRSGNNQNRGLNKNNTSGFKGVSWNKATKTWEASICVNRKVQHLGRFSSPEAAHAAYVEAAGRLHGDFANLGDAS